MGESSSFPRPVSKRGPGQGSRLETANVLHPGWGIRLRRPLLFIVAGLLVFFVAALGGFLAGARLAPDQLRRQVAEHSKEALGFPVRFQEVRLRLRWGPPWLSLDAFQAAAVLEPAAPRAAVLTAPRLEADLDPLALLLGRVRTTRLRVESPSLLLDPGAFPEDEVDATTRLIRALDQAGAALEKRPCALPDVELDRGRLLLAGQTPDAVPELVGDGIHLSFACGAVLPRSSGHLQARLLPSGASANSVGAELQGELAASHGAADLHLKLTGFELAAPGPLRALLDIPADAKGKLAMELLWARKGEGPQAVAFTARGHGIRARLPAAGESLNLHLDKPVLRARLSATPSRLTLHEAQLSEGALTLDGTARLSLPLQDDAPVQLHLALEKAELQALGPLLEQLPESLRRPALDGLARVEAGHLDTLSVEAHTDVAGLARLLRQQLLQGPDQTSFRMAVQGATVRVGESDRLEDLSGSLNFSGDRLWLQDVHGSYRGQPLPRLDAELSGLRELGSWEALHCLAPAPVPALPGVDRLEEWIRSRRHGPEKSSWQHLTVEADLLSHPVFGCAITDLAGEVRPGPESLEFEVERGIWAGVPLSANGRFLEDKANGGALAVHVRLGKPVSNPPKKIAGSAWAQGRFDIRAHHVGRWKIRGARGDFQMVGSHVALGGVDLLLAPGGSVQGQVSGELGSSDALPFSATIQTDGISGANLVASAQVPELHFDGRVHGELSVRGHLELGLSPLARARGRLEFHARDGHVNRTLPVVLALVAASRPFDPNEVGDRLEYRNLDLQARIEDGWIRSDTFTAEGPRLRVGAQAAVAVSGQHVLEGVVGLFFFPGLDSLIDRLPLLNRVILGPNGNLVGAYFALTGTWGKPKTRIVPIRSLASAPVVESVGSFVWSGIKRIEAALSKKEKPPVPQEAKVGS